MTTQQSGTFTVKSLSEIESIMSRAYVALVQSALKDYSQRPEILSVYTSGALRLLTETLSELQKMVASSGFDTTKEKSGALQPPDEDYARMFGWRDDRR